MRVPLLLALSASVLTSQASFGQPAPPDCQVTRTIIVPAKVENSRPIESSKRAYQFADGSVMFVGRFTVDADGSPRAYHPISARGQDALGNAGRPGNWWAIATHNCRRNGRPVVQGSNDPAPGFYVSMTAIVDPTARRDCWNQRRYVNSDVIPYAAMPAVIATLSRNQGKLVAALAPGRDAPVFSVQADQPPAYGIGEGSMELARRLGYSPDPRAGGTHRREIVWLVMTPRMGFPRSAMEVDTAGRNAFEAWGGSARLRACAAAVRNLPL